MKPTADFSEVESLGLLAAQLELLAANDTLSPACRERNRELARQFRQAQEDELIRLEKTSQEVAR